jgi:hypothetical protein
MLPSPFGVLDDRLRGTKTIRPRRDVPLTTAALVALDSLPARIDSPYVFGPTGTRATTSWRNRSTSTTSGVGSGGQRPKPQESRSRPDLRSPVDGRFKRARCRDHDVRAGPDNGNDCRHDRGPLRRPDRHPHTTASSRGSTGLGLPSFEATRSTVDQSMRTGTQSVA